MADFYKKDKKLSFQELIWKTLEAIREKASSDWRTPKQKLVIHSDWTETFEEEDNRKCYIQLVEFLTDLLEQEFKPEEEEKYKEILKKIDAERDKLNKGEITKDDYFIFKLESMRAVLRLILKLLKRNEYNIKSGITRVEESEEEAEEEIE